MTKRYQKHADNAILLYCIISVFLLTFSHVFHGLFLWYLLIFIQWFSKRILEASLLPLSES